MVGNRSGGTWLKQRDVMMSDDDLKPFTLNIRLPLAVYL